MRRWSSRNGGYMGLVSSAVLGLLVCFLPATNASCAMLNNCNGHGRCDYEYIRCVCDEGWGADADVAVYKAPDCSLRTCPSGKAWGDLPTDPNTAHAEAECSNAGLCNRQTGRCECFQGYEGNACQRIACPNGCSGHGQCLSMQQLALRPDAFPLGANSEYNVSSGIEASHTHTQARQSVARCESTSLYSEMACAQEWDAEMLYACVCDSSWEVGLGPGQRQLSEWFGPDCSQRKRLPLHMLLASSALTCCRKLYVRQDDVRLVTTR
jgi:hypothetical protein